MAPEMSPGAQSDEKRELGAPAMAPFLFLRRGGRAGACLEFSQSFSLYFIS